MPRIGTLLAENFANTNLFEASVERTDLANFKLHIPLIVTNDLPKHLTRVLANTQQIKIANQLLRTLENAGSKLFNGTDQQIVRRLKESVEEAQKELDLTEARDPDMDKILKTAQVVGGVATAAAGVLKVVSTVRDMQQPPKQKETKDGDSFGIKNKDSIGGEGFLLSSPYTEIEIQSGSLLKRMFGNSKYTISIKVYVVAVEIDQFISNLDTMEKIVSRAAVKDIPKETMNLLSRPLTKGSFGQVITDEMINSRAMGAVTKGKKYGCSLALSPLAVEELRYKNIDLSTSQDVKKLIKMLNVFDLFIIREDQEQVEYLDPDTLAFETIPYSILKVGNPNRRKVSLAID